MDTVYYQEIDVVIAHDTLLTVRKTPPGDGRQPYDVSLARETAKDDDSAGMLAYRVIDDIAER